MIDVTVTIPNYANRRGFIDSHRSVPDAEGLLVLNCLNNALRGGFRVLIYGYSSAVFRIPSCQSLAFPI
ncbi:MAG TPA: hypothetical protein VHR84_17505 [Terriglobales bacterium]|nr:hypothetical protein [Terriglobales bacterium]